MASPLNWFTPFIISFFSAIVLVPIVIRLARSFELVDVNDERKIHREKVSNFGGIPIFMAVVFSLIFSIGLKNSPPLWVIGLGFPLLIIGFLDDRFHLSVAFRIVMQLLAGVLVSEMGFSIFGFQNWALDMASTTFFVVLFINAYNFIDGINGLSGSLGFLASLVFGFVLWKNGNTEMASLAFAFGGGLAGFLIYNFRKKALIFMGDCGSTVLGFFIAILFMSVTNGSESATEDMSIWPLAIALTSIPVFDLFKVICIRLLRGNSPFSPDRSHIHHLFTDGFLSHRMASLSLAGWTMILALMASLFTEYFNWANGLVFMASPYLVVKLARQNEKGMMAGKERLKEILGSGER